jgi:hypothetical protein
MPAGVASPLGESEPACDGSSLPLRPLLLLCMLDSLLSEWPVAPEGDQCDIHRGDDGGLEESRR